jgi:hypothetical protein
MEASLPVVRRKRPGDRIGRGRIVTSAAAGFPGSVVNRPALLPQT